MTAPPWTNEPPPGREPAGGRAGSRREPPGPPEGAPPSGRFLRVLRVCLFLALGLAAMGTALMVFALVRSSSATAELERAHEACGDCCAKVLETKRSAAQQR
jgi:hypothetical protein